MGQKSKMSFQQLDELNAHLLSEHKCEENQENEEKKGKDDDDTWHWIHDVIYVLPLRLWQDLEEKEDPRDPTVKFDEDYDKKTQDTFTKSSGCVFWWNLVSYASH